MITIDGKQIKLQIWDTVSTEVALSVPELRKYSSVAAVCMDCSSLKYALEL